MSKREKREREANQETDYRQQTDGYLRGSEWDGRLNNWTLN